MDIKLTLAKSLRGTVVVPGDKSISHRALMIGALAEGESEIKGFLDAADPQSTRKCLQQLGVSVSSQGDLLKIKGRGLRGLSAPTAVLDAGNSGTTMRLLSGILAGQSFETVITGDSSLCQRPMRRIIEPLTLMGARIEASARNTAPLGIKGSFPLKPIAYVPEKPSAQVKSTVLLAGLFADGATSVTEKIQTRDHTERMLGLTVRGSTSGFKATVEGGAAIRPQQYQIPGDISSASFIIAAASLVSGSEVRLVNVGLNPTRTAFLKLMRSLGASIEVEKESIVAGEPIGDLIVRSSELRGSLVLGAAEVAELIDEIPIVAVTCAVSGIDIAVKGGGDLRAKESDRIHSVATNLRKMGMDIEEYPDGFAFERKKPLIPAVCKSFLDHRIAMAFGVAALTTKGDTVIENAECVDISFPKFWDSLAQLQQN